jgi:hypothetical protein
VARRRRVRLGAVRGDARLEAAELPGLDSGHFGSGEVFACVLVFWLLVWLGIVVCGRQYDRCIYTHGRRCSSVTWRLKVSVRHKFFYTQQTSASDFFFNLTPSLSKFNIYIPGCQKPI